MKVGKGPVPARNSCGIPPFKFLKHGSGFTILVPGFDCDSSEVRWPPVQLGRIDRIFWFLFAPGKVRKEASKGFLGSLEAEFGNRI